MLKISELILTLLNFQISKKLNYFLQMFNLQVSKSKLNFSQLLRINDKHRVQLFATHFQSIVLVVTSLFLLTFPYIFWPDGYIIGGDDSGLYFKYPLEYITNVYVNLTGNNVPGGQGSYFPHMYQVPFVALSYIVNTISFNALNSQKVLIGVCFALSFYIFYHAAKLLINSTDSENIFSAPAYIGALAYTLSPLLLYSYWASLLSIYNIHFIAPLIVLVLLKFHQNTTYWAVFLATVLSIFSVLIVAYPWMLATSLSLIPIILTQMAKYPSKFIKFSVVFIILLALLNVYYLAHFGIKIAYEKSIHEGDPFTVLSKNSRSNTHKYIETIASKNSIIYALSGTIQKNQFAGDKLYSAWYKNYSYINLFFVGIFLLALLVNGKAVVSDKTMSISVISFYAIATFLYTVSIQPFGLDVFLFFNDNIPIFSGLRNSIDKAANALALSFSFMITIALAKLGWTIGKNPIYYVICCISIIIIVYNGTPIVSGEFYRMPKFGKSTFHNINDLNNDFKELTKYIQKMPNDSARFVWFPMNSGGYTIVQDQYLNNHYYAGLSPTLLFSKKNDYNGYLSIPQHIFDNIWSSIVVKDWDRVSQELAKLNVKYLIANNGITKDMTNAWFYGQNMRDQQNGYLALAGKKLSDFGNRYSLYEVKQKNEIDKVFLNNHGDGKVDFDIVSNSEYLVTLSNIADNPELVLLENYSNLWVLTIFDGEEISKDNYLMKHTNHFGYANKWTIDKEKLAKKCASLGRGCQANSDGSINLSLKISFWPEKLKYPLIWVSLGVFVISIIYIIYSTIRSISSNSSYTISRRCR